MSKYSLKCKFIDDKDMIRLVRCDRISTKKGSVDIIIDQGIKRLIITVPEKKFIWFEYKGYKEQEGGFVW